jgi:hypothetical protein
MHWRKMMSHTSSDTKFVSKCHSGTERQVGAPFNFMLYWTDIIKLTYRAGTVCVWRCLRFKADDSFHTATGCTVSLLHTSVFNRIICGCRSGLRRGSVAARLLGLRVWIPPGAWMFVSCEWRVLSGETSATGRSLIQRSPTECGVSECDCGTSTMMRPRASRAANPWKNNNIKTWYG